MDPKDFIRECIKYFTGEIIVIISFLVALSVHLLLTHKSNFNIVIPLVGLAIILGYRLYEVRKK
jgi:hypothetical protein